MLKIKKFPAYSLVVGFIFLILGLLIISNKNIGFIFINLLSDIKKISPYDLSYNSTPIYKLWLENFHISGNIIIIISFLILFSSIITSARLKYPKIYFLIFIFIFTFIVSSYFFIIGADPHHDGILIKPAIDTVEGKILFRDSFTQYGALTTYLQALAILIFGKYLIVIRLLTSFFYGMISVLLWIIFSRLINRLLNTFFCVIWIFLAPFYLNSSLLPWSSVYALFFQLLALYFLIIFIEKKIFLYLFLTGVSVGLTFWCRQTVGVFLLILIIIFIMFLKFLLKSNFRSLLKSIVLFISGFLSISLVFIIWFLISNSLKDWWLQTIMFSIQFNSQRMSLYGTIGFLLKCLFVAGYNYSFIWQLFPIVNLIIFFGYLAKLFKKRTLDKKEIIILSMVFVSFASWLQYYPGPDAGHAFWAATPMIGLTVYFVWKIIEILTNLIYIKIRNHQKNKVIYQNKESKSIYFLKISAALIILLLLFSNNIVERIKTGFNRLEKNQILINSPKVLKGLQFNNDDAIKYYKIGKIIENFTEEFKGINVITTTGDALYLTFQENNKNFSPMYVDWGSYNLSLYPGWREKLNNYILEKKPIIVMVRGNFYADYFEIYGWDNFFISIPVEIKDDYFMLFQNKKVNSSQELNEEQIHSLDDSTEQHIALYGLEKLTFESLFFDNVLELIPQSSKSDLWLSPLLEHRVSATNIIINIMSSKVLKTILASYDNEKFIKFLYLFVLNRQPDEAGLAQWTDALKNGLERDQAIKSFLDSDEWRKRCVEISLVY